MDSKKFIEKQEHTKVVKEVRAQESKCDICKIICNINRACYKKRKDSK